jgi:hypothetical protein
LTATLDEILIAKQACTRVGAGRPGGRLTFQPSGNEETMALLQSELTVIIGAYVLAAIPVGAAFLAGRMSQLYRMPDRWLCRWWSRFALVIVAFAVVISAAGFYG